MRASEIRIGKVIAHGVAFDLKNSSVVQAMDLNELLQSVSRLFELLDEREVDYMLVGGIAMLAYVQGRNTQDD